MPICVACGVQGPGPVCPICLDSRQYVPPDGQQWTNAVELARGRWNVWREDAPGIWSVHTEPSFAIGQRAYLIQTREGNLLWDCISLLDEETIQRVRDMGGVRAMAVSHPHYYSTMAQWSDTFEAPLWIHAADGKWVQERPRDLRLWDGKRMELFGGLSLVQCGGHFDGYQVAHWNEGVLFAGDQPQVCMDQRWVSFMYSYPNMIPFGARAISAIMESLAPLEYDRLYGAFGRNVLEDAKAVVGQSAERYLKAIR